MNDPGDPALVRVPPATRRIPDAGARLARLARPLWRWARHAPDRLLHPRRRRASLERLRAEELPTSILFVCQGNIYRSPYAAGALVRTLPASARSLVKVASAGFVGPNRPSPPEAIALARRQGVELDDHRSSLLTPERVRAVDLVVVMDAWQHRMVCNYFDRDPADVLVLGDLDPEPIVTRAVADPWSQPAQVLEGSYARVERCVAAMARALLEPHAEE